MTLYVEPGKKKVKTAKHNTKAIKPYKKYSKESLLERLRKKDFPDYSNSTCIIDTAYTDLTTALQGIVNEIASMKDIQLNGNSKRWFNSDIMEAIRVRDKLKEKILRTKLHANHERFKEKRNSVQ